MSPVHRDHSADAALAAMAHVPAAAARAAAGPDGEYRAGATLPLGAELARQWRRRRTQLTLGFMVLLPVILAAAFQLGSDDSGSRPGSFIDLAQSSATNFVMVTLFFSAGFLLVVVVSLFFGDTVASEASWSSLKYLLAIPVRRTRLLRQKLLAAMIFSAAALVVLTVVAYVIGLALYGNGTLSTPTGVTFSPSAAVPRIGLTVAYIAVQLSWVAGLAFLMTVCTDIPLGAVGTSVLLTIVSQILDQITALGDLRQVLPTHYSFAWTGALVDPISWTDMAHGTFSSLTYALVLVTAAFLVFRRKDITS